MDALVPIYRQEDYSFTREELGTLDILSVLCGSYISQCYKFEISI